MGDPVEGVFNRLQGFEPGKQWLTRRHVTIDAKIQPISRGSPHWACCAWVEHKAMLGVNFSLDWRNEVGFIGADTKRKNMARYNLPTIGVSVRVQ